MKIAAVIIAGSRTISEQWSVVLIQKAIAELGWEPAQVIEGDAPGPDRAARKWARLKRIGVRTRPAKWLVHGKAAGPLRNQDMVDLAMKLAAGDRSQAALLALWDGKSTGTADIIEKAKATGMMWHVVTVESEQKESR